MAARRVISEDGAKLQPHSFLNTDPQGCSFTVQLALINAGASPPERRNIRHPTLDDIVER